jgi:hypothetical protein
MIDFHTHLTGIVDFLDRDPDLSRAATQVFGFPDPAQPMTTFLAAMDEAGIDRAVVLPIDCTTFIPTSSLPRLRPINRGSSALGRWTRASPAPRPRWTARSAHWASGG